MLFNFKIVLIVNKNYNSRKFSQQATTLIHQVLVKLRLKIIGWGGGGGAGRKVNNAMWGKQQCYFFYKNPFPINRFYKYNILVPYAFIFCW
jgi:hypothetical protein